MHKITTFTKSIMSYSKQILTSECTSKAMNDVMIRLYPAVGHTISVNSIEYSSTR